jgi:hypothetical protein
MHHAFSAWKVFVDHLDSVFALCVSQFGKPGLGTRPRLNPYGKQVQLY